MIDLVPTVLEATSIPRPPKWKGFRVPPLSGRSLVPVPAGDGAAARREYLWWLHEGNRAVRVGDLKLVSAGSGGRWELYDLALDRAESKDLADTMPNKVRALSDLWWAKARQFAVQAGYDGNTVRDRVGEPVGRSAHPAGVH